MSDRTPDDHCFREESPTSSCELCGHPPEDHTGCDCEPVFDWEGALLDALVEYDVPSQAILASFKALRADPAYAMRPHNGAFPWEPIR